MDYEKKYKEALERAEEIIRYYKEHNRGDETSIEDLEQIFSELKENEDEKIRKRVLFSLQKDFMATKNSGCSTKDLEDCIAWLEKQGEKDKLIKELGEYKVKYTQEVLEKHINSMNDKDDERLRKTTIAFLKDFAEQGYENAVECIDWLEKQGDKKTPVVDFNAKDWYVSKVDGKIHDMTYNPADKVEPKFKVKYAGSEYNVLEVKDIAGVTFYGIEDEPNHIDYVKADNCEIISGYGIKENGSPYPTKPSMFSEQKPAWSEEDEENLNKVIGVIERRGMISTVEQYKDILHTYICWLKSLKTRIGG